MRKIKRWKMILGVVLCAMILSFHTATFADVGSFDRYDSDSSSSSSHGSYSSSGGYGGSYGSGSYSSGGSIFIGGFGGWGTIIIIIIIIAITIAQNQKKGKLYDPSQVYRSTPDRNYPEYDGDNTELIASQIKANDPYFSSEKLLSWTKELFIKLQNAWTDRDWKKIRPFESNELFAQHSAQLQKFIDNDTINVMENICVRYAEMHSYRKDGDKEILEVTLKSVMNDYVIDAKTKQVLKGNKTEDRHTTYRLTFARKDGVKTKEGEHTFSTTNCPNCGAPTQITSAGECEYCGSVITTGEHDWVLINLEAVNR